MTLDMMSRFADEVMPHFREQHPTRDKRPAVA